MDEKEFLIKLSEKAKLLGIGISSEQLKKFYCYMDLLLKWNEKINLTAITEPNDIILKHFIDSITINKEVYDKGNVLDIGTGAGFPGIPLKILNKDTNFTLVDSLNKRINFLNEVKDKLELEKLTCLHARVEELAQNKEYRENFDIVTSRAVARLNVLVEYMIPFVKLGGYCICMKGSDIGEELEEANKAIKILGGKIERVDHFNLPDSDIERNIIIVKKESATPRQYPRKAGTPTKQPIV